MSKRCPECHRVNEDVHSFCVYCGATLDPHLRLIQGLEKQKEELAKGTPNTKQRGDVNFYTPHRPAQQKKSSAAPWVILLLIAAAAIAWLLLK